MTADRQTQAPVTLAPLAFRRLRAASGAPSASATSQLGGRWVGSGTGLFESEMLISEGAVFDGWFSEAFVTTHQHGCVRYATDGTWLHGCAEIDDAGFEGGLQAAARHAYAELFAVLAASRCAHLLRLWNYIANINLDSDGVERYRHFNAGRQQAFIDARRSAFDGAPAACALGTSRGPLRVLFLAGPRSPLAIENPRQVSAYRYPESYGTRTPSFSRAALADVGAGREALFISGTASIVGHATLHAGDVRRQTEETLVNITAVRELAAGHAGAGFAASELIYTVYVRHRSDLAAVREVFEKHVGVASVAAREAIYLQADICRAELLVEIEAHGFVNREART